MALQAVDFRDSAAARIAGTPLSVFFDRSGLFGAQFSLDRIAANARAFADRLEEQKREDDRLNELAFTGLAGMPFGFSDNREENKNWTATVRASRIPPFVRDAYRIAEPMAAQSRQPLPQAPERVPADALPASPGRRHPSPSRRRGSPITLYRQE